MRFLPTALGALCLFAITLEARHPVMARRGMVVAQEPLAADIGVAVLKSGGNAVDAAVAVAFALSVTYPQAGNLGGGGFLLLRLADGRTTFIDFRERAPQSATRNMYVDSAGKLTRDSLEGWRASGVPGTVRGLEYAHKKFGVRPWAELVTPAVQLASNGFPITYALAQSLRGASKLLSVSADSRRIFLKDGAYHEPGDILRQPELAATLERIAKEGSRDFYEGVTARRLATAMSAHGGTIALEDLRNYAVAERTPLTGSYRDYTIITAPPPSSGGVGILQMLKVLEGTDYRKAGLGSARSIHIVAETMKRFYADRSEHFGDPDFVRVPIRGLLAPGYVDRLRSSIDPERATPSSRIAPGKPAMFESSETTHLSIVDEKGNAAALTYTLNGSYGSGVAAPGLGFLLNNEMDDFSSKPGEPNLFGLIQGEANIIQPRKRPLSSMTPTLVMQGGELRMVLGAPGGGRIINGVLQVFLHVVDFNLNVQQAIDQPRFHHQWQPDKLSMERGFSPDTIELLKARGHDIEPTSGVALVEAIVAEGGWLRGGTDRRAHGKAAGY